MEHSIAYLLGMVVGVAAVAVIGIIGKVVFKKRVFSCDYDERQELIRGRAFKYGFWVMAAYFLAYGLMAEFLNPKYIGTGSISILGVGIGILVFAVYAIWHDAYYALTENPKRFTMLFGALMVLNLVGGIRYIRENNGETEMISVNLIFAVVFMVILLVQVLKIIKDKKNKEMD